MIKQDLSIRSISVIMCHLNLGWLPVDFKTGRRLSQHASLSRHLRSLFQEHVISLQSKWQECSGTWGTLVFQIVYAPYTYIWMINYGRFGFRTPCSSLQSYCRTDWNLETIGQVSFATLVWNCSTYRSLSTSTNPTDLYRTLFGNPLWSWYVSNLYATKPYVLSYVFFIILFIRIAVLTRGCLNIYIYIWRLIWTIMNIIWYEIW